MRAGGNVALAQPGTAVPGIAGGVLVLGIAIGAGQQLAGGIPAVALQPLVKTFFLHQAVLCVPGKAALGAVLVHQPGQAPCAVVLQADAPAPLAALQQPAPQVVAQMDVVRCQVRLARAWAA